MPASGLSRARPEPSRTVRFAAADGVPIVAELWAAGGPTGGSTVGSTVGSTGGSTAGSAGRSAAPPSVAVPPVAVASAAVRDGSPACVVAHGFTGSSRNPHVQRICRGLAEHGITVLSPDFRGHGRSGGRGTAGDLEIHDIAAAVAWLRGADGPDAPTRWVATLGWSMGGGAVLRHAGLGGDTDAVVSVSAAGTWFERGTRPMQVVHWMFTSRSGRAAARLLRRTRIAAAGWDPVPAAPAEVAGAILPRPLLIIHGDADHYFPLHHVESLRAAAPDADVWIEPAMGHAEAATSAELLDRIAGWLLEAALGGATPDDARAPDRTVGGSAVCDDGRRD